MAHIVKEKLKYLKEQLKVWNKEVYGYLDLNIENIRKEINRIEEEKSDETDQDGETWMGLNSDFWASLKPKESLLAQKARARWIQQGDGNTKFFHNSVKYRQRRKRIVKLKVGDRWIEGVSEIREEVRSHFNKQFEEENFVRPTLDGIEFKKISMEESDCITAVFTMEEVEDAIMSCEGDKSPGPDGFNFTFIKSCWNTIKDEIFELVTQFHDNGKLPKAFTYSFVALIGKCKM